MNTAVFAMLLVFVLCANLYVWKFRPSSLTPYYALLFGTLALNLLIPLNVFLGWPQILQGIAAGALVMSPVVFAGIIFSSLLKDDSAPERSLAYNTAGAILGGVAESASMLIGFQYLVGLAALIYLASWIMTRAASVNPATVQSAAAISD